MTKIKHTSSWNVRATKSYALFCEMDGKQTTENEFHSKKVSRFTQEKQMPRDYMRIQTTAEEDKEPVRSRKKQKPHLMRNSWVCGGLSRDACSLNHVVWMQWLGRLLTLSLHSVKCLYSCRVPRSVLYNPAHIYCSHLRLDAVEDAKVTLTIANIFWACTMDLNLFKPSQQSLGEEPIAISICGWKGEAQEQ